MENRPVFVVPAVAVVSVKTYTTILFFHFFILLRENRGLRL